MRKKQSFTKIMASIGSVFPASAIIGFVMTMGIIISVTRKTELYPIFYAGLACAGVVTWILLLSTNHTSKTPPENLLENTIKPEKKEE